MPAVKIVCLCIILLCNLIMFASSTKANRMIVDAIVKPSSPDDAAEKDEEQKK